MRDRIMKIPEHKTLYSMALVLDALDKKINKETNALRVERLRVRRAEIKDEMKTMARRFNMNL